MKPEQADFPFSRIGIVGLGLMGGSMARDLKNVGAPVFVRALSEDPVEMEDARRQGAIDGWETAPEGFFSHLDLVVYAAPLGGTMDLLCRHAPYMPSDLLITDVASLKTPILATVTKLGLQGRYVGSHPMAGGEGRGFPASRAGLFAGARIWLVAEGASDAVVDRIRGFWSALGGEPELTDPEAHDIRMAWISHLPQLTANALAAGLESAGFEPKDLGPGGRDMTRLARSNPRMWMDLLTHESGALAEALEGLEGMLGRVRALIMEGRIEEIGDLMNRTRGWWKDET